MNNIAFPDPKRIWPLAPPQMLPSFVDRIVITDSGCWCWVGALTGSGYARFYWRGKQYVAARLSLKWHKKSKKWKDTDHLCRNILCVNPHHLEGVTHKENILRGNCPAAINSRKEYCLRGHLLEKSNLCVMKNGSRRCKKCNNLRASRHYIENRKKILARRKVKLP